MQPFLVPSGWYEQDEIVIKSWSELKKLVEDFLQKNSNRSWVWRGQPNSKFALTSSLYRNLSSFDEVSKKFSYPSEESMQVAERRIVTSAEADFKLGQINPLLLFAKLQHLGAATRFIDVTRNSYVAIWFACQSSPIAEKCDGRLFAFGFDINQGHLMPDYPNDAYSGPFWFGKGDFTWGQGNLNVWFPPFETHQRVFAQNAGFIFDGVPIFNAKSNPGYRVKRKQGGATSYWARAASESATSIHVNYVKGISRPKISSKKTPVITIKIPWKLKNEILLALQREVGLTQANLFPGIEGMAEAYSAKGKSVTDLRIPGTEFDYR